MNLTPPAKILPIPAIFGLTKRDIILAGLLALRSIWQLRPDRQAGRDSGVEWPAWTEALFETLYVLADLVPDPASTISEIGYGVPHWLFLESTDSHGRRQLSSLVELEEALTDPERIEQDELRVAIEAIRNALVGGSKIVGSDCEDPTSGDYLLEMRSALLADLPVAAEIAALAPPPWQDSGSRLAARHDSTSVETSAKKDAIAPDLAAPVERRRRDEAMVRLDRFDIALCETDGGHAFLLSARLICKFDPGVEVAIQGDDQLSQYFPALSRFVPDWKPADQSFELGVERGIQAARNLLHSLGIDQSKFSGVRVELVPMLPPWSIEGESAALPVAIELLRQALELPPAPCCASGAIALADGHCRIEPLKEAVERAKSQAVIADGYRDRLVAVGSAEGPAPPGVTRLPIEAGMLEAARAVFGKSFETRLAGHRRDRLRAVGFEPVWPGEPFGEKPALRVSTVQARTLFNALEAASGRLDGSRADEGAPAPPRVVFLNGPAKTGKTFIAHEVSERLAKELGWGVSIVAVRSQDKARATLTETRRLHEFVALESNLLTGQRNRLIVIDGLEFDPSLVDLEHDLERLARKFGIWFLVVRRSDGSSDWATRSEFGFNAIVSPEEIQEFAELLAKEPSLDAEARKRVAADADKLDLIWLVDVANQQSPRERIHALVQEASTARREILHDLGYASIWGVAVPDGLLGEHRDWLRRSLSTNMLDQIGNGEGSAKKGDGGLLIRSVPFARELIEALSDKGVSSVKSAEAIGRILDFHLATTPGRARPDNIDAIIALCGTLTRNDRASGVAYRVISDNSERIAALFKQFSLLSTQFALLNATADFLKEPDALSSLGKILASIQNYLDGDELDATDLKTAADIVLKLQGLLWIDSDLSQSVDATWRKICTALPHKLGAILENQAFAGDRFKLVDSLLRHRDEDLDMAVAESLDKCLPLPPVDGEPDFDGILRLLDFAHRLWRVLPGNQGQDVDIHLQGWARTELASVKLDGQDRNLLSLCQLERLRVRLRMVDDDWEEEHELFHLRFLRALSSSMMHDAIRGLNGIYQENPSFLIRYLNLNRPFGFHFITAERHTAGEIADLLGALGRWHGASALELLYRNSWLEPGSRAVPHAATAAHFAKLIKREKDGRNAGRLIIAAARVDELYQTHDMGFAKLLVERIGREFIRDQFRYQPRIAILFHLTDGLLRTGHSYLSDHLEDLYSHLRDAIARGSTWAARLVRRLYDASDDAVRTRLVEVVSGALKGTAQPILLARNPDSVRAWHEMLCLCDPDDPAGSPRAAILAGISDAHTLDEMLGRLARSGHPVAAVEALRAMTTTARRSPSRMALVAGLEASAERKFFPRSDRSKARSHDGTGARGGSEDWRTRCLRRTRAEGVASLLDQLRLIDPEKAAELIDPPYILRMDGTLNPGLLGDKIRHLGRSPVEVVRLLESVEAVRPKAGQQMLQIYLSNEFCRRVIHDEIQFVQNPRTFAYLARRLSQFGYPSIEGLLNPYNYVWRSRIELIRSPAALVQLLSFAGELDARLSLSGEKSSLRQEATNKIDVDVLIRRLGRQSTEDLESFPDLIEQIAFAGELDLARELAQELASVNLEKINQPRVLGKAIDLWNSLGMNVEASVIRRFDESVHKLVYADRIFDEAQLLRDIEIYSGARAKPWPSQRKIDNATPRLLLEQEPALLQWQTHPASRLLAIWWLEPRPWVDALKHSALTALSSSGLVAPSIRDRVAKILGCPPNQAAIQAAAGALSGTSGREERIEPGIDP